MADDLTATTVLSSILQQSASIAPAHDRSQSSTDAPIRTGWSAPGSVLTKLFSGDPSTIVLAFIVTLSLPVLLHLYFYTQAARSRASGAGGDGIPTFLLLGSSGSGKTSLVTLLQRRLVAASTSSSDSEGTEDEKPQSLTNGNGHAAASPTRLSQVATTIGMRLPPGTPLGSNKYRSENDYEVTASKKNSTPYKLVDTPGHGKLRAEQALSWITRSNVSLRGVLFMLDSATIDGSSDGGETAKDTVGYLHDVLLMLQRRPKIVKKAKGEDVRVVVACNKQDLFTSLPPAAIRERLQTELQRVRTSKRRGVSAVDAKEDQDENEDETVLGGGGEGPFSFKMLEEEFGVSVDVVGGFVKGDEDGKGVRKWEEWIGGCL